MTSQYLDALFEYDSDANRQVLERLRSADVNQRVKDIFSHLLASQKVWITRLRGEEATGLTPWPNLSWDDCEAMIEENRRAYAAYLHGKSVADLDAGIFYKTTKGQEYRTPARDILIHVLFHGSYHRGQIAKALRDSGVEPINTDYIMYTRARD